MELYRAQTKEEVFGSLREGNLPQSILFTGPRYSGRLSLALDLCYEIAGRRSDRALLEPIDIVYFPMRDMALEIESEFNILSEKVSTRQRNNFISKVRLTLMQYHPSMQDAQSGKGKYFDRAGSIEELIYQLLDADMEKKKEFLQIAEQIENYATDPLFAFKGKKKGGISVDEVRAIQNFVSVGEKDKFIIIENIEDTMEASKNALLKILEEPPKGTHFILISENPQRIMQTILSRVRRFSFAAPTTEHVNECLKEWYLEFEPHSSFESFIYEMSVPEEKRKSVRDASALYFDYLMNGEVPDADKANEMFATLDGGKDFFLSLLMSDLEKALRTHRAPSRRLHDASRILKESVQRSEVFNLNIKNALDLALREASRVYQDP